MECVCASFLAAGLHEVACPNFVGERSLVRCGCGVVRNDEDEPATVATLNLAFSMQAREPVQVGILEPPRVCRGCGGVYQLPKQQEPA